MEYYREEIETDALVPARIFYGGGSADKLRYPLHWHQNLEFDLVLSGSICGRISGQATKANPGEIFFVNSGDLHETDGGQEGPLRSITVLLSDELLREYCPQFSELYFEIEKGSSQEKRLAELIRNCATVYEEKQPYYELELSVLLRQICLLLLKECGRKKSVHDPAALTYKSTKRVKKAITYMEENFENRISVEDMGRVMGMTPSYFSRFFRNSTGYKSTKRVKKAITYMEENFENRISVEDMGRVMGMTPSYFSRFFRNSTGQTFHAYLTHIRLIYARRILLEQEETITDIAMNCGFPNVKAFIDAFHREYGTTPAKYKKDKKQQ